MRIRNLACALVIAAVAATGCGGSRRAAVLVGQSGLATAQTVGQLQQTTKQLTDASVISPEVALSVQQKLVSINEKLRPVPDLLRTIERLTAAGDDVTGDLDRAIAVLEVVGTDLSVVIQGIPLADAAKALVDLLRQSQQTVQKTLIELAKLRGMEQ